jgi:hypothetical protein
MKFVGALLVSLLFAMGLSACTSSDDEWSGERTPSREAVDDVSEAKSEPEVAADDVPDAGPAAATDDVSEAETEPAAAARANDKEAECRDPNLFDYDEEDRAGNRREQVVFALELNEKDENEEEGGNEDCPTSADFEESAPRYDWTSIADVKDLFDLVAEQDPDSLSTEIVSNFVSVNPNPIISDKIWPANVHLPIYQSYPDFKHSIYEQQKKSQEASRLDQGTAALLPHHEWQGFYQDQHLMTFGVCDAVDEEATVFFFDPDFIDEKYEYHKVWSEGSTVTQRSIPVPRFRFPYKAEDAVQQPQLIGIKIVDVATKQAVGAALIEVFVTQVKTTAGKPTTEAGKETEDLYACKFDLKITRTYDNKTQIPDSETPFTASISKDSTTSQIGGYLHPSVQTPISLLHMDTDSKVTSPHWLLHQCLWSKGQNWVSYFQFGVSPRWDIEPTSGFEDLDHTLNYATETQSKTFKWSVKEGWAGQEPEGWGGEDSEYFQKAWLNKISKQVSSDIHEFLATVTKPNGEVLQRTYVWVQTKISADLEDNEQNCDFKFTTLTHRPQSFENSEELMAWMTK